MNRQPFIDSILESATERISQEMSDLLGQEVGYSGQGSRFIDKEEFLSLRSEKSVLTRMALSGDVEGEGYLVAPLKSSIVLGGSLILLPPDEIADRQKKKVFDGEVADAFGEIANIAAGVYTAIFLEKLTQKIHVKKTSLEDFVPREVDPSSDVPFPCGTYYLSSWSIQLEGEDLGKIDMLFPAAALDLELPSVGGAEGAPLILVASESQAEAESFAAPLANGEFELLCLSIHDDMRSAVGGRDVGAVFLVMSEVGERGFASIIKIQSAVAPTTPLVVAGPQWTKKTVLQAVKYGACDILMTPATADELLTKAEAHMKEAG